MQSPTIDNLTVSLPRLEEAEAQVSTLCELFDRAVATAPDGAALRHSGVTLTYREMGRGFLAGTAPRRNRRARRRGGACFAQLH